MLEQEREPEMPFGVEVINPHSIYRFLSLKADAVVLTEYPFELDVPIFLRKLSHTDLGGLFKAEATEISGIKGRDTTSYKITSFLQWPDKPVSPTFLKKYGLQDNPSDTKSQFDILKTYYPRKRVEKVKAILHDLGLEVEDDKRAESLQPPSEDEIIFSGLNQSRLIVRGPQPDIEISLGYTGPQMAATFWRRAISYYDNVSVEENSVQDVSLADIKRDVFERFGETIMGEAQNNNIGVTMQFKQPKKDKTLPRDNEANFIEKLAYYASTYATITKALYQEADEVLPNRRVQLHL